MIDLTFGMLLSKSIGVMIILASLLFIRPFIKKYLNATVGYSMWLLIPIFVLIPNSLLSSDSTSSVFIIVLSDSILNVAILSEQFFANDFIRVILVMLWYFGFVLSIGIFVHRYIKLRRSLSIYPKIEELPEQFKDELLKRNVNIVTTNLIDVPAVFGFFQSFLILPVDFIGLPITTQTMILKHEMYHIRRADHQFNILRMLTKSIFWFNPLVFIADKFCEADQEISCDLGVLRNSVGKEKKQYASAMLDSINLGTQSRLVSQWNFQSLVMERVKMLKNTNVKSWHKWIGITFSIFVIGVTNGVVMAGNGMDAKEPVPSSTIMPMYPRYAAEDGITGWVKLKFDIDKFGHVYNLEVVDANPKKVFEQNAKTAIKDWEFENNKGQQGIFYTMEFVLE